MRCSMVQVMAFVFSVLVNLSTKTYKMQASLTSSTAKSIRVWTSRGSTFAFPRTYFVVEAARPPTEGSPAQCGQHRSREHLFRRRYWFSAFTSHDEWGVL